MSSLPLRSPLRSDDPRRLGRYTLAGRLGRGAQGVVYLARTPDGRMVALKLLHEDRTARPGSRERLAKEAATARRVRGRCTARILDVDVSGPRPYIVSEYVAGPSLHRRVRERGPLGGSALDRLMIGSATALVAIHSAGIVHRDLKPANVLLGPEGPRVIDFGVAHVEDASTTLTGAPIGTPAYMAPEQVAGDSAGCPADVFAWASTMVYAATGSAPFGRDNAPAVMHRIAHNPPDRSALHGPVLTLLTTCLHKSPEARPTAEHVLRRLLELSTRKSTSRSKTSLLAAGTRAATTHRSPDGPREPHPEDHPKAHPEDRRRENRRGDAPRPDNRRVPGPRSPEPRTESHRSPGPRSPEPRPENHLSPRPRSPEPRTGERRSDAREASEPGRRTPPPRPGEPRASRRRVPDPHRGDAPGRGQARARAEAQAATPPPPARTRPTTPRRDRPRTFDPAAPDAPMSAARRRGYTIAVIITILIGLTLGITYPWANPDGNTPTPTPSATTSP